ncbi:hypothetical protein B0H10DRAFT_280337 [Mycena sp. CBHHK59/15]|nr:hypothetical protein B0H10DRAFT_280337 [Mycena sp. CBHHK59/15]
MGRETWVHERREYRTLINFVDELFADPANNIRGGVKILGHLGIGKSLSLIYMVIEYCRRNIPFVIQRDNEVAHLVCDAGVFPFRNSAESYMRLPMPGGPIRVLFDSGAGCLNQNPFLLFTNVGSAIFFLIVTCSPREPRCVYLKEHHRVVTYVMESFTFGEILGIKNFENTIYGDEELYERYLHYGPSARDIYSKSPSEIRRTDIS